MRTTIAIIACALGLGALAAGCEGAYYSAGYSTGPYAYCDRYDDPYCRGYRPYPYRPYAYGYHRYYGHPYYRHRF